MATVAGLNNKFIAAVEAAVKRVFNDVDSAEFKALAKVVDEDGGSNAAYIELERSDHARYGLIKRFQSKPPTNETLASVMANLKELSAKQIQALRTLHSQQLEKMEDELASTPQASEVDKHGILEVLKKAQKEQIDGVKKIAEEDQNNLTDFHRKFNRRMSAAMIIRHLGKEHDKDAAEKAKDMASQMAGTSSKPDLVQRFTLWGLLPNAVLKHSETVRGWAGRNKEEFEDWGGVEHEFARSYSMKDLVYKDGHWEYEEPTDKKKKDDQRLIGAEQLRPSGRPPRKKEEEDVWAINIQDDYFKSTSTHEYTDLGAAGALTPTSMPLKLFGAIFGGFTGGKFTIKYDYMPPDEELKLPGGPGLMMELAGGSLLSHSENMVRVGVLAHEAMARGWDSIEFRRMPPELKDDAYLAARRAGFAHEEIFYYGQLYSDELKRRGDYQRGIIEKAWEDKKPLNEIAGLAFNLPNPQIASPTEFFGQADPQDVLAQFNDPLTSRSQRAELLADAASYALDRNFGQMLNRPDLTQAHQKDAAAFIGELATLDNARALEMYGFLSRNPAVPTEPNSHIQFNVFKHLSALGANPGINPFLASAIMSEGWRGGNQQQIDVRRAALFKAISADSPEKVKNKAYLLLDDTLSSSVAAKLYHSVPEGEERTALLKALADITNIPNAHKLARLLVGIYNNPPLGNQTDPKGMMDLFDKISDQMPFLERGPRLEAIKKAFINHPELTFDERKRFLEDLEHTLDPLQINYREFLSLMTAEDAFFYLEYKYGENFRAEFLENAPFFGDSVDSDRFNKFVEIYTKTYNLNPLDPDAVANPQPGGRFHARVTAHIDENTPNYDGLAHAVAFFWSESQQDGVLEQDRQTRAVAQGVRPDTLPLITSLALQTRELLLMNPVHAAKILNRLSDDVVDQIIVKIMEGDGSALTIINAFLGLAARQDNPVDTQKVARSILRFPYNRQAEVLKSLATAADDAPKRKAYYNLLKSVGARTVGLMMKQSRDNNDAIFSLLGNLAAVQATPNNPNPLVEVNPDNVKFLAKVLTACIIYPNGGGVDISNIRLSEALRAGVLKHTNNKDVIRALMAGAIVGIPNQPDQNTAWADFVSAMEKDADKAKVFGGIPHDRQTAVLMTLPDYVQAVVFRGANEAVQKAFLALIIGGNVNVMTSKAANQILRLVSPSASGDRNLFNDVLTQQERQAVLKKATVIRPELLRSLWKDGDFATLPLIMDVTRFDDLGPAVKINAIDNYLEKVARAGLALTGDGDRPKTFFIEVLGALNPQTIHVSQVRAHMLMELVDNDEKAKAKDFFEGLRPEQKIALSNYIKTKYVDPRFNALRGVVGVERIVPPEQNQGLGQRQ